MCVITISTLLFYYYYGLLRLVNTFESSMVSWFSSGIVGVISMTFMRTLWMMYPKYLHDTNSVAATRDGLYTDCSELDISESHVRYNITSLAEASAIAKALNAPVVFKLFLPDHKVRWEKVYEEYKSHVMPQAEVEIKSFGNIFMAGTRTYSDRVRNVTLDDILYPKDNVSYYASFAQFLTPQSMNDLIGSSKFAKDTNFISNFESDVIASPIHSNTYVYSYSMQLLGRKLWLWASPDSMEQDIGVISTHTANFHYQGSEKSFFEKTQVQLVSYFVCCSDIMGDTWHLLIVRAW